jgi:hypothetical protein
LGILFSSVSVHVQNKIIYVTLLSLLWSFSGSLQGVRINSDYSVTLYLLRFYNWHSATDSLGSSRMSAPLVKETSHLWEKPHVTRSCKHEHPHSKVREFKPYVEERQVSRLLI